jgi:cytochrome b561
MKTHFHWGLRLLHWLMALSILTTLFVGIAMVTSPSARLWLYQIHKPLGILILVLVVVRLIVRLQTGAPALPKDMPAAAAFFAKASHVGFYALMFAMPLIGWATLSAGGYPITLGGGLQLPPLLAKSDSWYAILRPAHQYLAFLFFFMVLGHLTAALYHGLIRRDGVLDAMTGRGRQNSARFRNDQGKK